MHHIVLDSSPLSLAAAPPRIPEAAQFAQWTSACLAAGHKFYIPEVIDYELRRELLRAGKTNSLKKLDGLKTFLRFLPITSPVMLLAADLWAQSRQNRLATGDPKKLDIDVILAAQALMLGIPNSDLIVVTSNVAHISRFVPAALWSSITP